MILQGSKCRIEVQRKRNTLRHLSNLFKRRLKENETLSGIKVHDNQFFFLISSFQTYHKKKEKKVLTPDRTEAADGEILNILGDAISFNQKTTHYLA